VLGLLRSCHGAGQTIVLVTHDVKVATHAQRLVTMRDGEIDDDTRLDVPGHPHPALLVEFSESHDD
jgi:ABC-type lipoprotein export system ATPase subunit